MNAGEGGGRQIFPGRRRNLSSYSKGKVSFHRIGRFRKEARDNSESERGVEETISHRFAGNPLYAKKGTEVPQRVIDLTKHARKKKSRRTSEGGRGRGLPRRGALVIPRIERKPARSQIGGGNMTAEKEKAEANHG